ncbi:MAG: hypothetical protein M1814_000920 [Vezdaea aestivalis]|nr:MAG: hypothetical protein M1814_000920 [Vezdaea aestivalis]
MKDKLGLVLTYVIVLSGVYALSVCYYVLRCGYRKFAPAIRRCLDLHLIHPLVGVRGASSNDLTRAELLAVLLYGATNAFYSFFRANSVDVVGSRFGALSLVNMVPLMLGGRPSTLAGMLGLGANWQRRLHRSMGWLSIVQGIVHAAVKLTRMRDLKKKYEKFGEKYKDLAVRVPDFHRLLFVTLSIGINSIVYVRRKFFEIFLCSHVALSCAIVAALWFHLNWRRATTVTVSLMVSTGLFAANVLLHYAVIAAQQFRRGLGSSQVAHIYREGKYVYQLDVTVSWFKVLPGQYIYLTIPSSGTLGLLQAHPYMVSWSETHNNGKMTLSFLIESRHGFSQKLATLDGKQTTLVDGPYGTQSRLDDFDKVVMFAEGIGIASVLLYIRYLIQGHNDKTCRVRRIDVVWTFDGHEDIQWVQQWIRPLCDDAATRRIFVLYLDTKGSLDQKVIARMGPSKRSETRPYEPIKTFSLAKYKNSRAHWLQEAHAVEAGSLAVLISGGAQFEYEHREVVRSQREEVKLIDFPFKPDAIGAKVQSAWSCHL